MADAKPEVFFDGSCPLCRREISFYQRQRGGDKIDWIDVSTCGEDNVAHGLNRATAMKRFHIRRLDGTLLDGADAFFEMWSNLPRFALAARIGRLPLVRHVMELGYNVFLLVRPTVQRVTRVLTREL